MNFSFNLDQFLSLLQNYNLAVWPLQPVAYLLGAVALVLATRKTRQSGLPIMVILACFWLWTGGVFNLIYFRPLYPRAVVFAVLFVVQGIVFALAAAGKPKIEFGYKPGIQSAVALLMASYALVGYPLLETIWGRGYPLTLAFGLVPCPTALFSLAILLLADKKVPWPVWAIPILYSFGGVVPIASGIHEDIGLVAGGAIALFFLLRKGTNPENR